jgi:hypothetical protein
LIIAEDMSSLEQPRGPHDIDIGPRLRVVLGRLRAAGQVTGSPEIQVDRLREVEGAVGIRFNADLLAVFAAAIPIIERDHEMKLSAVIPHTGSLREARARGDLIGVGRLSPRVFLCVEMGVASDDTTLIEYDVDDKTLDRHELVEWLEALCARVEADEVEPDELSPRVIHSMPESYVGRRVRHKLFGEGKVLTEIGDGPNKKVKAEFPGRGLKLLAARFVEFLE